MKEILTTTKWNSRDRILEVLEEERAAMRADLPASGHATAAVRASAGILRDFSDHGLRERHKCLSHT